MLEEIGSILRLKHKYIPLNRIEISRKKLLSNYRYLTQLSNAFKIAPVLKSNAYGHGLSEIAGILDEFNPPFFCVDSIYEAYVLYRAKFKTPVLIMGYVNPDNLRIKKLPFAYAVFSRDQLAGLKKSQPKANIHIFVDTGMHREGISPDDLVDVIEQLKSLKLNLRGVMSHLAMADKPSNSYTRQQVKRFVIVREMIEKSGLKPEFFHIQASAAVLAFKDYPDALGNIGRAGIALYGIDPSGKNRKLCPVLRLVSTIIDLKYVNPGEKIGYDFTFTVKRKMRIAVLPIGYNDGVNRRLSNTGFVKINDIYCRIVGRVSMNLTIIDVSAVKYVKLGDEVEIYSDDPEDKNSIAATARLCDTIPYEILVQLHPSTRRIVV